VLHAIRSCLKMVLSISAVVCRRSSVVSHQSPVVGGAAQLEHLVTDDW